MSLFLCYNLFGGIMKKNIIYISCFLFILFILIIFSFFIMKYSNGSKYKFNDNVTFEDLISLYNGEQTLKICDNCVYSANSWDGENSSLLLEYDGNEYKTLEVYSDNFITKVGVGLEDYYKKVIAYYGIKDDYAYWNVELSSGDIYYYNYPDNIVESKDINNAYLRFVYYLEDGKWILLEADKTKKIDTLNIDEYIMFTFDFSFNGKNENVKDKTVASYSIYYKKKDF